MTISSYAGDTFLWLGIGLFCAGTLLGFPHGLSKRNGDTAPTELWRIAHLSTCVGGVSLIALTLALERLVGNVAIYALTPLSIAAYSFFLACALSGWLNRSWDGDRTQRRVMLIYMLQIFASIMSVVAVTGMLGGLIWKLMS
ncbi:hypothetical protein [Luteibacter sp.]|jgi:hypothetical protein|uniref:hypothetical protein n=1 Tax=Luteibacter sp. TaxID=1886636 RepID=UPI002F3E22BD